jgi:hypothetical protein
MTATVTCPRCRRKVVDDERGRNAHRQSCVKIPRSRTRRWGQKEASR